MKKWYLTQNDQLIDLNSMKVFWVGKSGEQKKFVIYCSDQHDKLWEIKQPSTQEDCRNKLIDIYNFLAD